MNTLCDRRHIFIARSILTRFPKTVVVDTSFDEARIGI